MDNEINSNGPRPVQAVEAHSTAPAMTLEWVAARMDAIIQDTAHITETIKALNLMDANGHNSKAQSMGEVAQAREATNRQTLKFLEKVYDDLRPTPVDSASMLKHLDFGHICENLESEHVVEIIKTIAGKA